MDELERYRGAMLGLAVGDALGAPVEGLKDGHILQLYGRIEGYVDAAKAWKDRPRRWRQKGLYTEDTQHALALADALVKCRGLNRAYFTELLLDLARAETGLPLGAHRGADDDFRATIGALQGGTPPDQAGRPGAGIAPMARAAPVGLYFAGEDDALLRVGPGEARRQSGGLARCRRRGRARGGEGIHPFHSDSRHGPLRHGARGAQAPAPAL
jgi:ADP-ribosyl-[dinitrogen reductase] hydrolase